MENLAKEEAQQLTKSALAADLGQRGDITSDSLVPNDKSATARVVAKEELVVCGHEAAKKVCELVDGRLEYEVLIEDGGVASASETVANLRGPARSLLAAERTLLNFLQRLSGVASLTSKFVRELEGTEVHLVDTRKTSPGWRHLHKYATLVGGAKNHRMGLHDAVLIKENHLVASGLGAKEAVKKTRSALESNFPGEKIFLQIEVKDLDELSEAIAGGPDGVLLDNFSPEQVSEALAQHIPESLLVEVSGGIKLENIKTYALSNKLSALPGVDRISVGALTHSAISSDLSLLADFES